MRSTLRSRRLLYSAFTCLFLAISYLTWLMVRPIYSYTSYPHYPSLPGQQSPVTVTAQPTGSNRATAEQPKPTTEYDLSPSFTDTPSTTVLDNSNASTAYGNYSNPTGDEEISSWSFDAKRDAQNYDLSFMQCNKAFNELFKELDRAKMFQKSIGRISPADININWVKSGAVKALIYNGHVSTLIHSDLQRNFSDPNYLAPDSRY